MHLMYRMGTDSNKKRLDEWINGLPAAQPEKRTEERTETHACDLISRQEAIDEIGEWIKAFLENGHKESAADARLIQDGIIQLPSAQPKIVRCKDCKWKQGSECVRFAEVRPFPDDFCSRAERRTDGSNR